MPWFEQFLSPTGTINTRAYDCADDQVPDGPMFEELHQLEELFFDPGNPSLFHDLAFVQLVKKEVEEENSVSEWNHHHANDYSHYNDEIQDDAEDDKFPEFNEDLAPTAVDDTMAFTNGKRRPAFVYKCYFPDCEKFFTRKYNLKVGLLFQAGELELGHGKLTQ